MSVRINPLDLAVFPSRGTERLFDGRVLQKGVHLRWSIHPTARLPPGGFQIQRRLYRYQDEFAFHLMGDWEPVATVDLPTRFDRSGLTPEEARDMAESRAKARLPDEGLGPAFERYRRALRSVDGQGLLDVLERLHASYPPGVPIHRRLLTPGADRRSDLGVRALDMVLMASIDPYIAQMVGLYWFDPWQASGGSWNNPEYGGANVADYRVRGLWEDEEWGMERVGVDEVAWTELRHGRLMLGEVRLRSNRSLEFQPEPPEDGEEPPEDADHRLILSGAGRLPLTLVLPEPVKELVLELERDRGSAEWSVEAETEGVGVRPVSVSVSDGRVRISSSGVRLPFDRVSVYDHRGDDSESVWVLRSISYGIEGGRIEPNPDARHAQWAEWLWPTDPPGEEEYKVPWGELPPYPVVPPPIRSLEQDTRPPVLGPRGRVPAASSSVEIDVEVPPPLDRSDPSPPGGAYEAVRMHVKRAGSGAGTETGESDGTPSGCLGALAAGPATFLDWLGSILRGEMLPGGYRVLTAEEDPPAPVLIGGAVQPVLERDGEFGVRPAEPGTTVDPADYMDYPVPDGTYRYGVQGIDIFGRRGDWSSEEEILVVDRLQPPPPGNVRAGYLPILGTLDVDAEVVPGPGDDDPPRLRLDIATDALHGLAPVDRPAGDLIHYPVHITGERMDPATGSPVPFAVDLEIMAAGWAGDILRLEAVRPPFLPVEPRPGDRVRVDFDVRLEVTWRWTGRQALFYPRTREFRVYLAPGPLNEIVTRIPFADGGDPPVKSSERGHFEVITELRIADAPLARRHLTRPGLKDLRAQVGGRGYDVTGSAIRGGADGSDVLALDLKHLEEPVPTPREGAEVRLSFAADPDLALDYRTPHGPGEWSRRMAVVGRPSPPDVRALVASVERLAPGDRSRLEDMDVVLPPLGEPEPSAEGDTSDTVFEVVFRVVLDTDGIAGPPDPQDYVPGAVAAKEPGDVPGSSEWRAYDVVWHEIDPDDGPVLYLHVPAPAEERTPTAPPASEVRYLPGRRFSTVVAVPDAVTSGRPSSERPVAVTAADGQTRVDDHLGDPDRYGNESAVGGPAMAVAVDRRLPPAPEAPEVEIGRADYYGEAKAEVRWDATDETDYNVYRATDSALFVRDLAQRRRQLGPHADLPRAEIPLGSGSSDPFPTREIFETWLDARFPDWAGRAWEDELFVEKPADEPGEDLDRSAWEDATQVWQAWAERFYPALTDRQVQALAGLPGNDTAFGLVTPSPVRPPPGTSQERHLERVEGRVRTRYLYRIEAVSGALARGSDWSPASLPARPSRTRPPRRPQIAAVVPGDREITLRWGLPRDPDVTSYRVYRAEEPGALDDLRHWGPDDDERLLPPVPDPRLRAYRVGPDSCAVDLPEGVAVEVVLGAFRADEFDWTRYPPSDQPRAFDYHLYRDAPSSAPAPEGTVRLVPIEPATPMVVVYADSGGAVRALDRSPAPGPLQVRQGRLRLSGDLAVAELLGVYRADVFDWTRDPPDDQPGATNAVGDETTLEQDGSEWLIRDLIDLPTGEAVTVVFRDGGGATRALDRAWSHLRGEYVDTDLPGAVERYYRVVAVAEEGPPGSGYEILSEGSKTVRARALEVEPPEVPEVSFSQIPDGDRDLVTLIPESADPHLEILMQRRGDGDRTWTTLQEWTPLSEVGAVTDTIDPDYPITYLVSVRSSGGNVSSEPLEFRTEPRTSP